MNIVLLLILLIQAPPRQDAWCQGTNGAVRRADPQEAHRLKIQAESIRPKPGYEWGTAEMADSVDVPPITEEYGKLGYEICDLGSCTFVESDEKSKWMGLTPHRHIHSTCADKKRFLMVSEDHRGHCIRLGGQQ